MQTFTEYSWERIMKEFQAACESVGADPEEQLNEFLGIGKLWNKMTGRGEQPQPDPAAQMRSQRRMVGPGFDKVQDKGLMLPTTGAADKFRNNAGYAQAIAAEIKNNFPDALRKAYASFVHQHPEQDGSKVRMFFNQVAKAINAAIPEIINKAKVGNVDGETVPVADPHMRKMVGLSASKSPTPPPRPKMGSPASTAPKPQMKTPGASRV